VGLRGRAHFAAHVAALGEDAEVVRIPPSEEFKGLEAVLRRGVWGVYVDEDLGGGAELEVAVSLLDKMLRRLGAPATMSALSPEARRSGARTTYTSSWRLGLTPSQSRRRLKSLPAYLGRGLGEDVFRERVENLLLGFQRELKLLAGAAGVSSFFNSLVGSRELMRAVELDRAVRMKLGVKQAGV
jgi:hypothetical protein